ncbi:MAG: hypothetical protein LBR68_05365, partial [Lachnoclostridium sp.]|nr:hypothetical protein [Lachnoclostridium sp.]
TLTLGNLNVDYTNQADYRSNIYTDITIGIPDFHLDGDSTLNELKKYIVISDDLLTVNNTAGVGGTGGASFTGNIYTGYDTVSGTNKTGIEIVTQAKAAFNSDRIISRGDLNVITGSDVDIRANDGTSPADMWMQNIVLTPNIPGGETDLYSDVNINANANIANSFVIDDNKSVVTLGGNFYGYSYNEENDASVGRDSAYSSAFLINGLNTTVNTPDLDKLILAGHAFVSRNNESGVKVASDIMMGESFSLKSNQIAYLLPDEYLVAGHNPVIEGENEDVNAAFAASPIYDYLDPGNPYMKNYISSATGITLVYYFLNFKDEISANAYFEEYYSSDENKEFLSDNARAYISTTDASGMKLDAGLYLIAGNIIHSYYTAGGPELKKANYYDASGIPNAELLNDGIAKGKEYVGRQKTLLPTAGDTMRLPDNAAPLVASKIIDFDEMDGMASGIIQTYNDLTASVIISPGDYEVNPASTAADNRGLIVAKGDVIVNDDFKGLIIAGGKVTVNETVSLEYDQMLTKSILKEIAKEEDIAKFFRGIDTFEGASVEEALSQSISYQNWSRNEG